MQALDGNGDMVGTAWHDNPPKRELPQLIRKNKGYHLNLFLSSTNPSLIQQEFLCCAPATSKIEAAVCFRQATVESLPLIGL